MKKRNIVEAIIINYKGEFLLQKKTLDYPMVPGGPWCFFGGEIENGENPINALKRELKEEIGYFIDEYKQVKTENYKLKNGVQGRRHLFKISFKGKISEISLQEGAGFAFFNYSELDKLNLANWKFNDIKEYINSQQSLKAKITI